MKMMPDIKHIIFPTLMTLMLLATSGCTRNNGDIGDWFGKWQVMEICVDGHPEAGYESQVFWEFQNDIIRVAYVNPEGYDREVYYAFGTWSQPSDNTMTLDFTHSDDSGTGIYIPTGWLHFPKDTPVTLTIVTLSDKDCTMKYVDEADATEYTYILRKR